MLSSRARLLARPMRVAVMTLISVSATLSAQQNQHYTQTNLVSDQPGVAPVTDSNLVNPWGLSRGSGTPWWVSDNGMGVSTLYSGAGAIVPLVVTIPSADGSSMGNPTGTIFNGTHDFQISPGVPAKFLFVTEDGTVSGWNGGTAATIKVNTHGASIFKGVTQATFNDPTHGPSDFLYVADFHKGHVNVYDAGFHPVHLGDDAFRDEKIPAGFAPFNVQDIGGNIYVAFAKQDADKHDEVAGAGLGYVDVFSPSGKLLHRLDWGSWFNAPWGMAQAPSDFGAYSHCVLVGQFGSGQILVFDVVTGRFLGRLRDAKNMPITIDGLWAIEFGSGTASGPANSLFFTAGTDDEQHGLFGMITPIENLLGSDI